MSDNSSAGTLDLPEQLRKPAFFIGVFTILSYVCAYAHEAGYFARFQMPPTFVHTSFAIALRAGLTLFLTCFGTAISFRILFRFLNLDDSFLEKCGFASVHAITFVLLGAAIIVLLPPFSIGAIIPLGLQLRP